MIFDLHNDFLTKLNKKNLVGYLKNNNQLLSGLCCPIFTTELKNATNFIKNSKKMLKKHKNCYLCIEDMSFLESKYKSWILRIKPLYCGICWNNSNQFCGGAYDVGGISKKGKQLIEFLQDNNIIVDCAHMNIYSYNDLLNITKKPIFCSHAGFKDIINDKRNLDYYQLKDLVESGGIVGLYFVGKYISNKSATCDDIIKNIEYFVNKFGVNNLAIGTDFYGTTDLPFDVKNYKQMLKIKQKLLKIGYKNTEIEQIFEKNAKMFIKKEID